jgi:proteasome lid subunit RPN8/RPN11
MPNHSMKMKIMPRPLTPRRLLRRPRETRSRTKRRPRLRFSPTAWAKLLYLRDRGPTEVGGFGIAPAADLLYVEDIRLVQQTCTSISVAFDDSAVAEFFDEQIDAGRRPEQVGRIWIHTHPGDSAQHSHVDEETFSRVFGPCDWAVMFILAHGGEAYCRLRFRAGPGGAFEIPVQVDFEGLFVGSDFETWASEYDTTVRRAELALTRLPQLGSGVGLTAATDADDLFDRFFESFDRERSDDFYERSL